MLNEAAKHVVAWGVLVLVIGVAWLLALRNGPRRTPPDVASLMTGAAAPNDFRDVPRPHPYPPFANYPHETVETMAEIGEAFMDAMPKDYSWSQSPAEVIAHLDNRAYDAEQLNKTLADSLEECATRFESCCRFSGSDAAFAGLAVEEYRKLVKRARGEA